jgi:hypothetical protein
MLGFVNDEHIFSILTFMKDNLWNWLNQRLDTTLSMFAQTWLEILFYQDVITCWKDEKMCVGATT